MNRKKERRRRREIVILDDAIAMKVRSRAKETTRREFLLNT